MNQKLSGKVVKEFVHCSPLIMLESLMSVTLSINFHAEFAGMYGSPHILLFIIFIFASSIFCPV